MRQGRAKLSSSAKQDSAPEMTSVVPLTVSPSSSSLLASRFAPDKVRIARYVSSGAKAVGKLLILLCSYVSDAVALLDQLPL